MFIKRVHCKGFVPYSEVGMSDGLMNVLGFIRSALPRIGLVAKAGFNEST